jgi:two-component system chemotaxis sensor kinase CheA
MDAQDALSLIFRSEVSTSAAVTSISGRGLGLAIVRDKVEALGGSISVRTEPGAGASFRILLPVTLSTFRGILVDAHGQLCIAPTANVERVARLRKDQVKTAGNRDTVDLDDRAAPLIRLGDVLGVPRPPKNNGNSAYFSALILRSGDSVAAFSVDEVLQEQEVLVKPLNKQLSRVRNIAGATVLGSGLLAPILNVADLMKSAFRTGFNDAAELVREAQSDDRTKAILVVEDSITSRMLLKNILETAGYEVTTAVDGAEGWTAVRSRAFDLVVSDIEMPRMNGLELTAKIRGSGDLGDMPVVLVTSRGSREDREGGIDAGANAYIVKGSFDQDNLLETVRRLI